MQRVSTLIQKKTKSRFLNVCIFFAMYDYNYPFNDDATLLSVPNNTLIHFPNIVVGVVH
jgi:hypothetical protein